MTPADFAQAAVDLDLHRRAGAMCSAAEPHRDAGEDWPCTRCLYRVASALSAVASTSVTGPASGALVDGAAGPCAESAARPGLAASPSENNRPRVITPRPAEGATAIARTEGTR